MTDKWTALLLVGAAIGSATALPGCRPQGAEVKPGSGRDLYSVQCAVCHGEQGEGIEGKYPPVKGSAWVRGSPDKLAALILNGVTGPMGRYNGVMPGWGAALSDAQIAELITWLRSTEGLPPYGAVQVGEMRLATRTRNTFWTAAELKALKIP